jgi:hypothetical protein
MRKIAVAAGVLMILTLSAGIVFAGCEEECDGPFKTCMNICRQTTKADSPEAARCVDNCLTGVSGCVKKCKARDRKSENIMRMNDGTYAANDSMNLEERNLVMATSDKGLFSEPVPCTEVNAVKPVMVAAGNNPCPGKVYCASGPCEHCCEWGYFYSTPCDCRCYKSSHDASASGCRTYFRCN